MKFAMTRSISAFHPLQIAAKQPKPETLTAIKTAASPSFLNTKENTNAINRSQPSKCLATQARVSASGGDCGTLIHKRIISSRKTRKTRNNQRHGSICVP